MSGPGPTEAGKAGRCDPVCQFFLNGFGKKSLYTLTNFPSFYSPRNARPCTYVVALYDELGSLCGQTQVIVPAFGTVAFHPGAHFEGALPELGMVSVAFADGIDPAHAHLGLLRPYFYAVFHDDGMGSIIVVHPQTTILDKPVAQRPWRSNLIARTAGLDAIEVFQLNPLAEARETSIEMCDTQGGVLAESAAVIAPRGARRIYWPRSDFAGAEYLALASRAMTALNAKPLLVQHRAGGFTAAHS